MHESGTDLFFRNMRSSAVRALNCTIVFFELQAYACPVPQHDVVAVAAQDGVNQGIDPIQNIVGHLNY